MLKNGGHAEIGEPVDSVGPEGLVGGGGPQHEVELPLPAPGNALVAVVESQFVIAVEQSRFDPQQHRHPRFRRERERLLQSGGTLVADQLAVIGGNQADPQYLPGRGRPGQADAPGDRVAFFDIGSVDSLALPRLVHGLILGIAAGRGPLGQRIGTRQRYLRNADGCRDLERLDRPALHLRAPSRERLQMVRSRGGAGQHEVMPSVRLLTDSCTQLGDPAIPAPEPQRQFRFARCQPRPDDGHGASGNSCALQFRRAVDTQ